VYLSVCLSVGVSARCDLSILPPEAIRHHIYLTRIPPEAMPLYPANLPPEAVRDFSTLQIYRRRPSVNISTLQIYRRRPIESSKGYTILAADGVVAMALALRC
jgi:hypothetical protein